MMKLSIIAFVAAATWTLLPLAARAADVVVDPAPPSAVTPAAPAPTAAPAAAPANAAAPDLVLMPRQYVDAAREFIRHPQTDGAVDLWAGLTACENANLDPDAGLKGPCKLIAQVLVDARAKTAAATPAKHDK